MGVCREQMATAQAPSNCQLSSMSPKLTSVTRHMSQRSKRFKSLPLNQAPDRNGGSSSLSSELFYYLAQSLGFGTCFTHDFTSRPTMLLSRGTRHRSAQKSLAT